jgi:hypothetical protein
VEALINFADLKKKIIDAQNLLMTMKKIGWLLALK